MFIIYNPPLKTNRTDLVFGPRHEEPGSQWTLEVSSSEIRWAWWLGTHGDLSHDIPSISIPILYEIKWQCCSMKKWGR